MLRKKYKKRLVAWFEAKFGSTEYWFKAAKYGWIFWKACIVSFQCITLCQSIPSNPNIMHWRVVLTGKDSLTMSMSRKANTFARRCQWLLWCYGPPTEMQEMLTWVIFTSTVCSSKTYHSTLIILLQSLLTMLPVSSQDNRRRNQNYGSSGYRFPCSLSRAAHRAVLFLALCSMCLQRTDSQSCPVKRGLVILMFYTNVYESQESLVAVRNKIRFPPDLSSWQGQ